MILFKDPRIQRELSKVDARLRDIITFMEWYAYETWKDDIVITSIYRPKKGSVHALYRGIDIALLVHGDSEQLRRAVNYKYPYDVARPSLETIPALDHGTAPHIHVQVKPREE